MTKKAEIIRLPEEISDDYDDCYDDFEDWEDDYYYLSKEDYQGLLKHRKQYAESHPDDPYAQARLVEAYNLVGDYDQAIRFGSQLLTEEPEWIDVQHYILDALFATGRDENDFNWIKKPVIIRLTPEVLDFCYDYLRPKRKPRTVDELYMEFLLEGYVLLSETDLCNALVDDERFIVDNLDDAPFSAKVRVMRKKDKII